MKQRQPKPRLDRRATVLPRPELVRVIGGGGQSDAPSNVVADYSPDSDRVVH